MKPLSLLNRLSQIRPLLSDILHQSPARIAYVLGLMIISSLSSGVGILLIIPLLDSVDISLGSATSNAGVQPHINAAFEALGLQPGLELILSLYLL
ncbi:MAG: hypothetical protein RLN96_07725, partial [Pseudomonadales bacterium]